MSIEHKLTVRMSTAMRDALAAEAERQGVSSSELIRRFVAAHVLVPGLGREIHGVRFLTEQVRFLQMLYPQKIEVIKHIRGWKGLGLKEAKAIADTLWVEWEREL